MLLCKTCLKEKEETEFYKRTDHNSFRGDCKECTMIKQSKYPSYTKENIEIIEKSLEYLKAGGVL